MELSLYDAYIFLFLQGYELTTHATANFTRKMMADYLRSYVSLLLLVFALVAYCRFYNHYRFNIHITGNTAVYGLYSFLQIGPFDDNFKWSVFLVLAYCLVLL